MPTQSIVLSTSITADHDKGRKATDLFRAAYNKACLPESKAQDLNENPAFPARLLRLIEEEAGVPTIRETNLLKPVRSVTFPARSGADPNEFFRLPFGCSADDPLFRKHVFPAFKPVLNIPERTYAFIRLKKDVYEREIRPSLPRQHCGQWEDIESLMGMYGLGEEDAGHHIIYLKGVQDKVFPVDVLGDMHSCEWSATVWSKGEDTSYDAGTLILCPLRIPATKAV